MFYQFHMSIEEDISGEEYLTLMMFPEIGGKKILKSYNGLWIHKPDRLNQNGDGCDG